MNALSASSSNSPYFNDWASRHGQLFVSHAIHPNNLDLVMQRGRLLSTEAILKTFGSAECEVDSGGKRGVIDGHRTFVENRHPFRLIFVKDGMQFKIVPKKFDTRNLKGEVEEHEQFWVERTPDDHSRCSSLYDDDQERFEDNDYRIRVRKEGYCVFLDSGLYGTPLVSSLFEDIDDLDRTLRAIFKYGIEQRIDYDHLSYELGSLRRRYVNWVRASEIRVEKNCVRWAYGTVAVLMSDVYNRIAYGRSLLPNPSTDKMEFHLKIPFQTEEDHYAISLAEEDVVILGSRSELNRLREDPTISLGIKKRFVDKEDLTPTQKALLDILKV
jgi:hypothetical protein